MFPHPVVCGWCGPPVLNVTGQFLLDPCCPGGPLSAADPGEPLAPFLSCLAQCLVIQAGHMSWVLLNLPVLWVALLRAWLVAMDVMSLGGHHFLIIHYSVIYGDLDPYCFVRNPCILHLNECYLKNYIFRVCIKPGSLLKITKLGVQPLYQGCSMTIKLQQLLALGASMVKLLNCFNFGFSCKFGT